MPLSSNSIFHFTNSADHLFNILKNNFIPRYCLERIKIGKYQLEYAVPVICFCDIPLSQIKNHIMVYGNYGIGLYKTWAIKTGINPVIYLEGNSNLTEYIDSMFEHLAKIKGEKEEEISKSIVQVLCHLKAYEGNFLKNDKEHNKYRFYDEREWRYIPENASFVDKRNFQNDVHRNYYNSEIEEDKLIYHPNDISYIIIKDSTELMPMVDSLKFIKGKYNKEEIDRLITKILTIEQIMEDF